MSEPLKMEFVVDVPPGEFDLQLINLLIRQAQNGEEAKSDVIRACKLVLDKLDKPEEKPW